MANYFIFQVNPQTDYKLSEALEAMAQRAEKTLWLSPKPEEKRNATLHPGDIVYLWTSASNKPTRAAHLLARGEVTQAPAAAMDMPAWQQPFCVDKGLSGPQFHRRMPRAEIEPQKPLAGGKTVDRDNTDANAVLKDNNFLKKRGFYTGTIFRLSADQARALDVLAGW